MINTSSASMSSYHHNHYSNHYMTPTRTKGCGGDASGSDGASTRSPTTTKYRASTINNPQQQQHHPQLRPATSDFLFSIEYDLFLKNLVGYDQGSPPVVSPIGSSISRKSELFHSASFSPQPMHRLFIGGRPQSTVGSMSSYQHYPTYQQHLYKPSHSLSSSASSTTSSPARRPFLQAVAASHELTTSNVEASINEKKSLVKKNNIKVNEEKEEVDQEMDDMEDENLSHQHLHALHRFRRQREKGIRSQLRDIVISFTPRARGSILDREHIFVRYGPDEQKAMASFEFLLVEVSEDYCATHVSEDDKIDMEDDLIILEYAAEQSCDKLSNISSTVNQLRRLSFSKSRSLDTITTSNGLAFRPMSNSFDQTGSEGGTWKVPCSLSSKEKKKKSSRRSRK